jgi:hypothetical protein
MTITTFKPNAELYDYKNHNPSGSRRPTLDHIKRLLFQTAYPRWLLTTMSVAIGGHGPVAGVQRARRHCDPTLRVPRQ